ncbi:MAG: Coenzyme PQQ synthesis protein D (PqqD) [Candidatus Nitrotoga sp. CP45]|nr:MAG: Coenzyme PQQ synthesis protein D (PqqD) [Candidatus Nitrotoga sp. CP45]
MSIPKQLTVLPPPGLTTRPRQRPGFAAFPVANELVLLSPEGEMAHALNESATDIWSLCDGQHTPYDMLSALRARYNGEDINMLSDLTEVLFRFHHLGLIELAAPSLDRQKSPAMNSTPLPGHGPRIRFVFGIEDKPYFHWQLAILFESLVGQLATGWDITVVVCNDHEKLSKELTQLIEVYGTRTITGANHAHSHKIDFSSSHGGYVALNRVEALKAIAAHVEPDDIVCLMDTDLFLYGDMRDDLFPTGNAMASNNIINDKLFMSFGSDDHGIDLQKLLDSLGCDRKLKRGGVTVFMTGATVGNDKIIQDCFRFAQITYLLGKAAGLPNHNVWLAEMACFAMALTANGIDYELLDVQQFAVPEPQQATLPEGSFFHYYADINDGQGGPFLGSQWNKQLFHDRNFLIEDLESFRMVAQSDVERCFLDLSIAAKRRLHESCAN